MSLTVFQFDSTDIRFVEVKGKQHIVAIDLLRATGSTTKVTDLKAMVVEDLGDEFVSNEPIVDSLGRTQIVLTLSEPARHNLSLTTEIPKRHGRDVTYD